MHKIIAEMKGKTLNSTESIWGDFLRRLTPEPTAEESYGNLKPIAGKGS